MFAHRPALPDRGAAALAAGRPVPATPPVAAARPALVVQASDGGAAATRPTPAKCARARRAQLSFRVGGKLARRAGRCRAHGSKTGQALAELDPADLHLQAEASRAQLASARVRTGPGQVGSRPLQEPGRPAAGQPVRSTTASRRVQAAEARVRQAQAQAAVVGQPGRLCGAARAARRRDRPAPGRSRPGGRRRPDRLRAGRGRRARSAIALPEQSASALSGRARPVPVELWAEPGKRFPGTIREISPAADPQARTYAARVELQPPAPPRVELGQSARVYALRARAHRRCACRCRRCTAAPGPAGASGWWTRRQRQGAPDARCTIGPYRRRQRAGAGRHRRRTTGSSPPAATCCAKARRSRRSIATTGRCGSPPRRRQSRRN